MRHVTFRRSVSLVVHCVTNVQGGKRASCNTTVQGPKLLVCAWTGFRRTADNFSPSTLQSGTSPLELQSVGFPKYPDTMPAQCDLSERPDDVCRCLQATEKTYTLRGYSHL